MKIGILAYQSACNFGANLQVLSTVGYLRKQGHEPRVINYEADDLEQFYRRITPSTIYATYADFRQTYMPLTARCRTAEEIAETIEQEGIEAVIIGSDAVAQHHPLLERVIFPTRRIVSVVKMTQDRLFPNPFWGTFIDFLSQSVPMALLSASCQNSNYKGFSCRTRKQMRHRLGQFAYISARDEWTSKMYVSISRGKLHVPITPDPVFAFNQNFEALIPAKKDILEKYGLPDKYMLLSFMTERTVTPAWIDQFANIAARQGIACVAMPFPQGLKFRHRLRYEISQPLLPPDWYALIKYSEGYIGGNMHPIIVSLHNANPFFSFDNWGLVKFNGWVVANTNSSKIYHILSQAGFLENRVSCIGRKYLAPSPEFVFEKLQHFDTQRAQQFATGYYAQYEKMMSNILNSFAG